MYSQSDGSRVRVLSLVRTEEADAPVASPVLPRDLPRIVDDGTAPDVLRTLAPDADPAILSLLRSCRDYREGRLEPAAESAREAALLLVRGATAPDERTEAVLAHLGRLTVVLGDPVLLADHRRLVAQLGSASADPVGPDDPPRDGGDTFADEAARLGSLSRAPLQRASRRRGAASARLASIQLACGDLTEALATADRAVADLSTTASPRETGFAELTAAAALVLGGRHEEAIARYRAIERVADSDAVIAAALADHRAWFGDPDTAWRRGEPVPVHGFPGPFASADPALVEAGLDPAAILRATARSAVSAVALDAPEAAPLIRSLHVLAGRLGASLWLGIARCLEAIDGAGLESLADRLAPLPVGPLLAMVSPAVLARLDRLDGSDASVLDAAVVGHPERWRAPLRAIVAGIGPAAQRLPAARLLAHVGERPDVGLIDGCIRGLGIRGEDARLAKELARRVAPVLTVQDLGRVAVATDRPIPIGRRKVLALLCFLVTQPEMAATREQVLDALWQDQDPETAANSLNQTIYFLRRAIEPVYRDRVSPDYLHHDAEVVWLDPVLVRSWSRRCRELIVRARAGASGPLDELLQTYVARFALDFSYDGWSDAYRESLHAAFLATMEVAIARAGEDGNLERAIDLAQRTLNVEPAAEVIELALLRLYRRAGAHAAAAEQYAHYAAMMRDELGVEPPALEDL